MTSRVPVCGGVDTFLKRVGRKGYNQKVTFNQRPRAIEVHAEEIPSAKFRGRSGQRSAVWTEAVASDVGEREERELTKSINWRKVWSHAALEVVLGNWISS